MEKTLRETLAEKLVKHNVRPQRLKQKFSDMPVGVRGYYLEEADFIISTLKVRIKAKTLTDEQQDACTPTQKEVEAYINTPDDAVAAKIRKEYPSSFKIIAASVLYGQKIAAAQLQAVLKELE